MARSYYSSRRRSTRSKSLKVKKSIPASASNMYKMAKAIKSLQKKQSKNHQRLNFIQKGAFLTTSADFQLINLCDYNAMTGLGPLFGADSNDWQGNQMTHKSMGIQCYVDLENINGVNEEGTVHFSAYLVSLRDSANNGVFNPANGNLNLIPNVHYVMSTVGALGNGGMAFLNKKMFRIHKKKYFTLSNREQALGTSASQTQYGTNHQWYWKLAPNSYIKNPTGNWASLQSALDPSKQYYLLLFNDNSLADAEAPQFQYSVIHTIQSEGQ